MSARARRQRLGRRGAPRPWEGALRRRLPWILSVFAPLSAAMVCAAAARAVEPPRLSWDRPVRCIDAPGGGTVRVQCEKGADGERCLVAPNQLAYDGGALDEVQPCAS